MVTASGRKKGCTMHICQEKILRLLVKKNNNNKNNNYFWPVHLLKKNNAI
jgi:hypothetical protein